MNINELAHTIPERRLNDSRIEKLIMTMYAIKGPEEDRIDKIVQSLQTGEGDLDGVIFRL